MARNNLSFKTPRTMLRRRSNVRSDIDKALQDLRKNSQTGLHLGAGATRIEGLVNCDLFDARADAKVDALDLHEYPDGSVDLIEHHHMIEHLSFQEFEIAMSEWSRVLCKGGYLVMTAPDILAVCRHYVRISKEKPSTEQAEKIDYAIKMIVGSQEHEGMFHKNHLDRQRVERLLPPYGFNIEFMYNYPARATPSLLVVAKRQD